MYLLIIHTQLYFNVIFMFYTLILDYLMKLNFYAGILFMKSFEMNLYLKVEEK